DKLPYDPNKDFKPVSLLAKVPSLYVVNPNLPVKNLKEFVALAQSKPGKLNYGSAGNGSAGHLAMEYLKMVTNTFLLHIPYKGTGPAIADLLGGQVQAAIATMTSVEPHIKAGKLKALGVTTPKRSQAMPEIPTIAESGLAGYDVPLWYSILAPAGTPREVVGRLSSDIAKTLQAPDVRERLAQQGFEISYLNA
ncbi:tripartite tricarboxylate transporter substrate-binding protein, partial [Silanimonas algicola]